VRQILHPGPVVLERKTAIADTPIPLRFALEPGLAVDAAVAQGFAASGCIGGFVAFESGSCEPFNYVMPAASPDAQHAAWYSETFGPMGRVTISRACAIVGVRDEKPFIHCHGIWETAGGRRMGHMLASSTRVAEPIEVIGIGFRAGTFEAVPNSETNFMLFEPVQVVVSRPETAGARALLAKVRPNEDISRAIEEICSSHRIRTANVYGIGSLNGARFIDGTQVDSHATEVLIRKGSVESAGGRLRAQLAVDVVDMDGSIFSGELVHGDNPVCVTFEMVIEATEH
jgi:predicted DNA-binding protein with PD1-like motif